MKIGIVVPVYQRPDCFERMLDSLFSSSIPEDAMLIFVNDGNTDFAVLDLLDGLRDKENCHVLDHEKNLGVADALKTGLDYAFCSGCEILVNIDADMIVKKDWLIELIKLHIRFPNRILTGYNCCLEPPIVIEDDYCIKLKGVGGANLVYGRRIYQGFIRQFFSYGKSWDVRMNLRLYGDCTPVVVKRPSLMQHIGLVSTVRPHLPVISFAKDWHDETH